MERGGKILLAAFVGLGAYEFYIASVKRSYRKIYGYAMASDAARKTGKPLIVVGCPDAGNYNWFGKPDYPCGDLVVDIEYSPYENSIQDDLRNFLPQLENNSCVIYTSSTLEYIDNLPTVMNELYRVTGGDLFVTNLEPDSIKTALLTNFGYHFDREYKVFTDCNFQVVAIDKI